MITAYVVLALITGMLVVGVIRLAISSEDHRADLKMLRDRVHSLEASAVKAYRADASDAEIEKLKNRIGRLRARIRKLEGGEGE